MRKLYAPSGRITRHIPFLSVLAKSQEIASLAFAAERVSYRRKQQGKSFFYALLNPGLSFMWFRKLESPEYALVSRHRPKTYFKPFRPYISMRWEKKQRIKVILDTYRFILRNKNFTKIITEESIEIADLQLHDNTKAFIKLGYDYRYRKEGELVLTFESDSLGGVITAVAFSLEEIGADRWVCRIGCIQGHEKDDQYSVKAAQKLLQGLRPKSLVIFAVQELSRALGINAIYGAGDSIQAYRGKHLIHIPALHKIQFDYDVFWEESGGKPVSEGWYELPLMPVRKDIKEIKSNKRALYHRRYELMDLISSKIDASAKRLLL
jgi:hypothetical protein